jgi:hypothetical protein
MPTNANRPAPRDRDARPGTPGSPFPRYERISERLNEELPYRADGPRELEIPRTESFGELWRRAQMRRLRNG